MNNAHFRKLFLDTPRTEHGQSTPSSNKGISQTLPKSGNATPVLGSRQRSAIPMTPRSVFSHADFQRQLAEHRSHEPPTKKFKASAAPLGTKLPEGYLNRSSLREQLNLDPEVAEREERLQRLIEFAKDPKTGEVDMEMVMEQSKALGGDVKGTHLVKGLDFALLERVRKGEDVMAEVLGERGKEGGEKQMKTVENAEEDLEKELDNVLEKPVIFNPSEKPKEKKKGEMAQKKKTREEFLAELKMAKQAAAAAAEIASASIPPATVSILGSKFRKIGEKKSTTTKKKKREENEKKNKRKPDKETEIKPASAPLGMIVPTFGETAAPEAEDDMDIFEGVGDYDPLAGIDESSDDDAESSPESDKESEKKAKEQDNLAIDESRSKDSLKGSDDEHSPENMTLSSKPVKKPNYFNEEDSSDEESTTYKPPTSASALLSQNPELAAAIAKAAKLAPPESTPAACGEEEKREKRKMELIRNMERDDLDLDMGFGGSRDWGEEDDDEIVDGTKKGNASKKRKRGGGKKKKGDKNDADLIARLAKEKYGKG